MKWSKITDNMLRMIPARDRDPKVKKALLNSKFLVLIQDNFTAILIRNHGNIIIGVAKKNSSDIWNAQVAGDIAMVRAYRAFKEEYYETH